jgi:hypothetical protein
MARGELGLMRWRGWLPDVPLMGDFLPGYVANGWQGLGAPCGFFALNQLWRVDGLIRFSGMRWASTRLTSI